ncbi:hypothetical protein [Streptomyces aureocirculatus]|uniref:hypothetical protein n=1 Tax=Streptomyces aureocirculatus TaxID=67275 RepID=UPI000A9AB783|nr:hypothetical protein [Streptomyces aureocirculatus]
MNFPPPQPPWAANRPELLDDDLANLVHEVAVELQGRGYPTLWELPEQADDLPPQVVARAAVARVMNFRCRHQGTTLAGWDLQLVCSGPLGRSQEQTANLDLGPGNRTARDVVARGLAALGLAPHRSSHSCGESPG